ncbi:MAG TPA: hypothetical protein VF221_05685 [Chloroflexota bacterium]
MIYGRLRHTLTIVSGAAAALGTWQRIMRSSGPDAPIRLTFSAISAASQFRRTTRSIPMSLAEGPERLDFRTRLEFFVNATILLGPIGLVWWSLVQRSQQRRYHNQERALARQELWKRLTAIKPHGKRFTLSATAIGLLNGIGTYRNATTSGISVLVPNLYILGQVFPKLPMIGLAGTPHISLRRQFALQLPALVFTTPLGLSFLRAAFMSQCEHDKLRRMWERHLEETTSRIPQSGSRDEPGGDDTD